MEQIQEDLNISEEQEEEEHLEEEEALEGGEQSLGEEMGEEISTGDVEGEEAEGDSYEDMKHIDESGEGEACYEEESAHDASDFTGEGEPDTSTEIVEGEEGLSSSLGQGEQSQDPDNEPANSSIEDHETVSEGALPIHDSSGTPVTTTDNTVGIVDHDHGIEPGRDITELSSSNVEPPESDAADPTVNDGVESAHGEDETVASEYQPTPHDSESPTVSGEQASDEIDQSVDNVNPLPAEPCLVRIQTNDVEQNGSVSKPSIGATEVTKTPMTSGTAINARSIAYTVATEAQPSQLAPPSVSSVRNEQHESDETSNTMFVPGKALSSATSSSSEMHQALLEGDFASTSAENPAPEIQPGPSHIEPVHNIPHAETPRPGNASLPSLDDIGPSESQLSMPQLHSGSADIPGTSSKTTEDLERRLEEASRTTRPLGSNSTTYTIKRSPSVPTKAVPQLSLPEPAPPKQFDQIVPQLQKKDGHETDDLATLANAALTCDQASNGVKSAPEEPSKKEPVWCDVGIIKGSSCLVTSYYEPSFNHDQEHENMTIDNLPDFANRFKIDLEPGTAYKFRVCAINSCGRGPWSEVSAFKTCLPGYPGAPSSIKISKSAEGAHLSWEPPSNPAGNIIEYSVCLAVKNSAQGQPEQKGQQLAFVRVYSGPHNQTVVPNSSLHAAHIDTTSKPAIIFRIAAKNEKGFGPATQVRWLQDVVASPTGNVKPMIHKKETIPSGIPVKRPKIDDF